MNRNWKRALLVLPPLVGCGVLAWQGAHRPERLIVGKWQTGGLNFDAGGLSMGTIVFRPNGTFEREGFTLCGHREWGWWHIAGSSSLVIQTKGEHDCPSHDQPPSHPLRSGTVWISGHTVRVSSSLGIGEPVWKRIE